MSDRYKVVFDDLEAANRESINPVIAKLTFGISFYAESLDDALAIAAESVAVTDGRMGNYHVEPVEERPR